MQCPRERIFAAVDGLLAAIMIVSDPIKPSTPNAVEHLKQLGYEVVLISGDNEWNRVIHCRSLRNTSNDGLCGSTSETQG